MHSSTYALPINSNVISAMPFVLLFIFVFLAIIPAKIASKKGYSFGGFYILGIFFFLIALIVALCLNDKNSQLEIMQNTINSKMEHISSADEIKKYSDLLAQGAITQEEFDNIKKQLINNI